MQKQNNKQKNNKTNLLLELNNYKTPFFSFDDCNEINFQGYASVFNIVDTANDVILPTAFDYLLNLKQDVLQNLDIKILWQHDTKNPIGLVNEMIIDDFGLFIKGKIVVSVIDGQKAINLINSNVIKNLSIGYFEKSFYIQDSVKYIRSLNLFEVSLVTFPANIYTNIEIVK